MGSNSGHAGEAFVNQFSTRPLSIVTVYSEKLAIYTQERACTRNLPYWHLNLRLLVFVTVRNTFVYKPSVWRIPMGRGGL